MEHNTVNVFANSQYPFIHFRNTDTMTHYHHSAFKSIGLFLLWMLLRPHIQRWTKIQNIITDYSIHEFESEERGIMELDSEIFNEVTFHLSNKFL